ncbi:MAG: hypothetical protein MPJ50_04390 [Pirellulales bacterium]|nr:hypothetical protein [Pirellulales bacterium]
MTLRSRLERFRFPLVALLFVLVAGFGLSMAPPVAIGSASAAWQQDEPQTLSYDDASYAGLEYREIGPFRGGRAGSVTGVPGEDDLYYMGATGGGVWRTTNGGDSWQNISDGYFGGSIGAVAVSEWDPNVIYVGGGEATVRGNVSSGNGMWKSVDAGKTWKHIGLSDTRHIPRIRIHPKNPDLVYVAALGHLYGPNDERGVYRSKDGGKTWEQVLFVNANAGACDLLLDPNNPRVIYASMWRILRTPYSLESGGEGSGMWKSTDGGDTWTEITRNPGLPRGTVGISGIAVSPVDSNRVWAIIEAADGGVFRSENAGATWRRTTDDRNLRQRAWYYSRIYAGPQDIDEVYVLNVGFHRSTDGGVTFDERIGTPHGDHHDLWIDPANSNRMAIADDGGAQVSYDRGRNWSTYMNQPTAQFYRVITDNHFPYRIYGAQQDNSTVRILHRTDGGSITENDWESTAGGESGHIAIDPDDQDIVYGGSYGGLLIRRNHRTGEVRNINAWPDNPMGHGAEDLEHRFQWNFPIFFSPHQPKTLYTASQVLFKSHNEGQTWIPISPDLTRNDLSKLGPSGGPITKDNTGVEYYATIFAAQESPHEQGVIWCGSDDGLLHVTRDGGENWEDVTPVDLPKWAMINSVEVDPFEPGGLYVAATCYKLDDFRPYLYRTKDYGKTWTQITTGIDAEHFTRVVRADPGRQGLLYAGTENGMYLSFDDGASWKPFQLNLPLVPITDLTIKNHDLIVATQGRSFWVLDDLTPLHQMSADVLAADAHFYEPRPSYRIGGGGGGGRTAGTNAPGGAVLTFQLASTDQPVTLEIREADGDVIRTFSTRRRGGAGPLRVSAGLNRFVWNLGYPNAETFQGMILWSGNTRGPRAVPGTYEARLTVGRTTHTRTFEVLADPRSSASQEDLQAQFDFLIEVRDKLTETHRGIRQIRSMRNAINDVLAKARGERNMGDLNDLGRAINAELTVIEEALYQTKNESGQDPLNFPIRLNNRLAALASVVTTGAFRPTDQAVAVRSQLVELIDIELAKLKKIVEERIPEFNKLVKEKDIPAVSTGGGE